MNAAITIATIPQQRLGPIWVALTERGLVGLHMRATEQAVRDRYSGLNIEVNEARAAPVLEQLAGYFEGEVTDFDAPVDWSALAPFQKEVLQLVCQVPYGKTTTYNDIALQMGKPGAARAVGRANATNPIPVIVPCHRVLGAGGKLHGYGGPGGVETKAWLLKLEGSRLL